MKRRFPIILFYFSTIMYLEIFHKYFLYQNIFDIGLLYTLIFSIPISIILSFFSQLFNSKTNQKITLIFLSLITIIFAGNFLYYQLFSVPFTIRVTSMAGQALSFISVFFQTLWKNIFSFLLLVFPLVLAFVKIPKIKIPKIFYFEKKNLTIAFVISYIISILSLLPVKNEDYSAYHLYWNQDNLTSSIRALGLLTAERIDIQRSFLGFEEKITFYENKYQENEDWIYNKLDINFDKLIEEVKDDSIKSIYSYFKNAVPTNQNEYTGLYKGKNLIFILAESFNSIAVSKELTPTLYQLTHSGFQFNNYYSPVFLSTTGGEFQAMTGLVPTVETLNEWYKGEVSLPFSIGNALERQGYKTYAYHNFEVNFYNRDKTMPTLGFPNYIACGNGLEEEMLCDWSYANAPDDEDLIKVTFDKYKSDITFVTYYITMSGHFPYEFTEKTRNYELVKDLSVSDTVKAYLASQIDLDQALQLLIKNLEQEGILDDTVICLVGDHYPYALSLDQINEASTYQRDEQFEIHHSNLIIWNNDSSAIEINKIGSQIDILPTLLNLFGIEYDSRLLIGHDILSEEEGLAIFQDMSWISDSGSYSATTKTFTKKKEVSDDYINQMNRYVNNSTIVSKKIIASNIYQKIWESIGEN